jgi:SAM-dependent methyltransferase
LGAGYVKGGGFAEALLLYRSNFGDIAGRVTEQLEEASRIERMLAEGLGEAVVDKQLLEIGPGPHGAMTHYFGARNACTGIDIEVADKGGPIAAFFADRRASGTSRALRNLFKNLLGLNRRYAEELAKQIGVEQLSGEIRRMDATQMTFEADSFDGIYSLSAFEHIPEPAAVMTEIERVLKPGGAAVIITHFITSDSGIHDPRLFEPRQDLPWWPHLRSDTQNVAAPNCYVNWIRLDEYRQMFDRAWPGAEHRLLGTTPQKQNELAELRSEGLLQEYSDEELVNDVLVTIWKKPHTA